MKTTRHVTNTAKPKHQNNNNNNNIIYLFTAIGLLPGGSGYFTCKQNMKLVTTKFNLLAPELFFF